MRFITLTFDANCPTIQQVNVPTNTDYKVGMKVKRNGEVQNINPSGFTITSEDGTTLSVDTNKTNGYVTFTQASNDNASFKQLSVVVNGTSWKANFKINVNVFNSQEGEIEGGVQTSDLSSYVKKSDMSGYAKFKILRDNTTIPQDYSTWYFNSDGDIFQLMYNGNAYRPSNPPFPRGMIFRMSAVHPQGTYFTLAAAGGTSYTFNKV